MLFLDGLLRRRLLSLLRPWLAEEPDLDIKVGLLDSHVTAKNLTCYASALNCFSLSQSDSSSPRFSFEEVTIEHLSLRFSNCTPTAFDIEVRGVSVVLSLGKSEEEEEERFRMQRRKSKVEADEDESKMKKKALAALDPEGSALHDVLERMLEAPSGSWFMTSVLNLVLRHWHLRVLDVRVQVRLANLDATPVCLLELKELNAKSQSFEHGCILRGFVAAIFRPLKEASFVMNFSGFSVGYLMKDQLNSVLSPVDFFIRTELNNLQVADLSICVPELNLLFSPVDVPVVLAFHRMLSRRSNHVRNGRQLWRLVSRRLGNIIFSPRLSFRILVESVCLWLRYLNAYEGLLLLLGHSADHLFESSVAKISEDRMLLRTLSHDWKLISSIEKELPSEAIAQARRIARFKAASNTQCCDDTRQQSYNEGHLIILSRVLLLLASIWSLLCCIYLFIVCLFLLLWCCFRTSKLHGSEGVVNENHPQYCLLLNFGKVVISLLPANIADGKSKNVEQLADHINWFCLTIDALIVARADGIFEHSLSLSCGAVKVRSSLVGSKVSESWSNNRSSYLLGSRKRRTDSVITVFWSEPAEMHPSSAIESSDAGQSAVPGSQLLKKLLGEMWSSWKRATLRYSNTKIEYSENPWLLCEIKSSLTHFSKENLDCATCNLSLTLGKLNSVLRYSSVVSMALLLGQVQHALNCLDSNGRDSRMSYVSDLPPAMEGEVTTRLHVVDEFHTDSRKYFLLNLIPEKRIQLAVFITGLQFKISLTEDVFDGGKRKVDNVAPQVDTRMGFDIQSVELVASPDAKSDLALPQGPELDDSEYCVLEEPQKIEIHKIYNEKYASRTSVSLGCYMRANGLSIDIGESHYCQIFILKLITIQLSSFRESIHLFCSDIIFLSAIMRGMAGGFNVVLYLDELYDFLQVLAGLCFVGSNAFTIGLIGFESSLDFMRLSMVLTKDEGLESKAKASLLIATHLLLSATATFRCKLMEMVVVHSQNFDKAESPSKDFNYLSGKELVGIDFPNCGVWIALHRTSVAIYYEGGNLGVAFLLSELCSVVFRNQDRDQKRINSYGLRNLLQHTDNWLYEISLANSTINLCFGRTQAVSLLYSSGIETSMLSSDIQLFALAQKLGFASDTSLPSSSHWILLKGSMNEVLMTGCSSKNIMLGAHQSSKLEFFVSIGGDYETISCVMQGGLLCLETTALRMFLLCTDSYLSRMKNLSSIIRDCLKQVESNECEGQETPVTESPKWEIPQVVAFDVRQFSLVFVIEDDLGGFHELELQVDAHVKLESANLTRNVMLNLSRMSLFSKLLWQSEESHNQGPSFSSFTQDESSSNILPRNPELESQEICIRHENHIVSQLVASLLVEKHENAPLSVNESWVGRGSVSGVHVIISLSEIKMILSIISSFSAPFTGEKTTKLRPEHQTAYQDTGAGFEDIVPDGSIVAIQDVHQHLYFAVERGENKYSLFGVNHYSLVGDKALFRVKHHWQRTWKKSVLGFSLISVHVENDFGESLRLIYSPGSSLVDISISKDGGWSLWRTLACAPEDYKSGIDWELSSKLVKDTFYMLNKKNDCAVAFIDGIPQFVKKPGNPFKFKVFHCETLVCPGGRPDGYSLASLGDDHSSRNEDKGLISPPGRSLPCIHVTVDNVSVTVVHELLGTKDRLSLLRCAIDISQLIVQVLLNKTRVMIAANVMLYYFDAQRYVWRELINPIEVSTYYRANFLNQGSETVQNAVPLHVHCKIKECSISLSELPLDILLFVIGELNLAGPFSIKSSLILANCCKVENQSGSSLLCHFYDNKTMTVARKQSATIFLRHPVSESQTAESDATVAIQLTNSGPLATSLLRLSLLKSQALAWRTRIMSCQDSRTYPGPVVVVHISRKSEDGVSVVVSPLIRIQNETEFSLKLRFHRPHQSEDAYAFVSLNKGDSIDDTMATFNSINLSGGVKKALMSLTVGNFFFSFRPEMKEGQLNLTSVPYVEWSEELKGGKAVQLSGIFDKLGYKVRQALSVESMKCSFSTASCAIKSGNADDLKLHFLIQTISREVPIFPPDGSSNTSEIKRSTLSLQEQKEIFLRPTVRVSNFLHSEISVLLSETDPRGSIGGSNLGKQTVMSYGETADFYVNPVTIYFGVTLTAFKMSCKPVNSGDLMKKFKIKKDAPCLDIVLDFGGGMFASLRLSRGLQGVLEAAVFTPYSLKNSSGVSLLLCGPNRRLLSREEIAKLNSSIPSDLGLILPPNSLRSWFSKSHMIRLKTLEGSSSEALLDLSALSGLTDITLGVEEISGIEYITKFGVSIGPSSNQMVDPSQTVTVVPRHVIFNDSEERISIRPCDLQNEMAGIINVNSKERATLKLQKGIIKNRELSLFENIIRKHRNNSDTKSTHVQFQLNHPDFGWSGPVCISSLGRFFLKFRKHASHLQASDENVLDYALVHVVEEGSTLGVHFQKPPNINLPYLIENRLHDTSFAYHQKDSSEHEVLGSGCDAYYVWDDLTLPHKLVVVISDIHFLREINLDKVRPWKPFLKSTQHRGFASYLLPERKSRDHKTFHKLDSMEVVKVGYEVFANGPTRVLRICEFSQSRKREMLFQSCAKIQLRVQHFSIHLLEPEKQKDLDENVEECYMPIVVGRLGNINLDSLFTEQQIYNLMTVQSAIVEQKWLEAPFAAMLRRHQEDLSDSNTAILKVVVVLLSTSSNVRQVKFSSILLQPIDVNLDEETLMRLASFWRTSLSSSNAPSQQYYFDHFEIDPIKIFASFLPGDSYSSYNTTQETLRSLLHSVVKIPPLKNMVIELNGVLVTHALITIRELSIRCAQHYSWYALRAIYIAKGSPLLPPAFASIFDDLSSSSLDVFFDPSSGLINLSGATLGTFKFLSQCINGKGFSGTKRYFGDLGKTLRTVGSNMLFAAVTEISDSVLTGAETNGFDGMVTGFRHGILKLAMEPSVLGTALMGGGPDRKIKLDRSPGVDELYIEGYLQAMLDCMYRQEYLKVRVIDDQIFLKNLPPNSALIDEIMDRVKGFLVSKALLKGDPSTSSIPLRYLHAEREWKIGPTVITLFEHLFVSFAIRMLRKQTGRLLANLNVRKQLEGSDHKPKEEDRVAVVSAETAKQEHKMKFEWKWGVGKFLLSGILAYVDGRLCRCIPNPVARRIVSGYLLSFLDKSDGDD